MLALSAGSVVDNAGSIGAVGAADGSVGSTGVAEGSAGSTGTADGSVGSTGAARVGVDADLDGAAIEFAVDAAAASPSVPQMR